MRPRAGATSMSFCLRYLLWRYLDELLPAPLYRAVTLVQVHEPALPVAEQLHLDVPRLAEGQGWRVRGGG